MRYWAELHYEEAKEMINSGVRPDDKGHSEDSREGGGYSEGASVDGG
jgi:hypothetical protein